MDQRNIPFTRIMIFFTSCLLSACNFGKGGQPQPISKFMHSAEGKLTLAYQNYLGRLEILDYPSAEQKSNSMRVLKSGLINKAIPKPDLFFFPSTLWQVYSVSNSSKWEQEANFYSNYLRESYIPDLSKELVAYERYLHLSYLYTKDRIYLKLLLSVLSAKISCASNDSQSYVAKTLLIENLCGNQVLFFASKETGDPVYRNFALQNSELIYKNFIQGAGEKPDEKAQLSRSMAIGMYEFSYLYRETGMEKYKCLSDILATQFIRVYDRVERGDDSIKLETCINDEMDLISQALVSIALYDLAELQGNQFRETSARLFQHILATLGRPFSQTELQPSFQLYYFLFEYQIRLQSAGKQGHEIDS